jgi:hypothetical protein
MAQAAEETGYDLIMAGPNMPTFPSGTGQPELVVLPYVDFMARQSAFHPYQGNTRVTQDCTHWCSAPFLYMPLWRSLRLPMDWQFGD